MITKNYIILTEIPLHANVDDDKILPYIPKALRQLRGILPSALYNALQALEDEGVKYWSKTNSYVLNDKAVEEENGITKMWKSKTSNSDSKPTTSNTTDWEELTLGTLLVGYVKPFLAHHVFYAYAVNGGVNISHQGLQQVSNETAQAANGNALQSFLNYWKGELENHRQLMFNYLDEKDNTLDSVSYTAVEADRKKRKFQIRPIGAPASTNSNLDMYL